MADHQTASIPDVWLNRGFLQFLPALSFPHSISDKICKSPLLLYRGHSMRWEYMTWLVLETKFYLAFFRLLKMIQKKELKPFSPVCMHVCSVVPDSLWPHGIQPARLLCPWDFPSKNTGVGRHALLQGIFPTQGSTLPLLHWQVDCTTEPRRNTWQ